MHQRCRPLLGTFVEVTADRENAIGAAFAAVEHIHQLMSAHEPNSDVSQINRFGHLQSVTVNEWTARVIERALHWSKRSEGAFDIVRAGKEAVDRRLLPLHTDQPPPEASHWTWLEIQGRSVRLLKPSCIDLGGIAKGFAVDRAVDALRGAGCECGLVNAGGDLRGFGPDPWPVSVVDPLGRRPVVAIQIDNEALATSAGLPGEGGRLVFDHLGGERAGWVSVSVVTRTACDADALTKILWAAAPNAGTLLAEASARAFALTGAGAVVAFTELAEAAA